MQRGLHGFIKSLAKEIGRNGSTANLLMVEKGGDAAIEAPIRFSALRWLGLYECTDIDGDYARCGDGGGLAAAITGQDACRHRRSAGYWLGHC